MGIFRDFTKEAGSKSAKEVAAARDAENARCYAAMQAVNSCVMIADENNVIVKVNPAAMRMMQKVEGALRKELPDFSVEKMIGSNIDQFHKNPQHQQQLLSDLSSVYRGEIKIGAVSFELTANPIFDEQRKRIGTVVEWEDISARLAAEQHAVELAEAEQRQAAVNARIKSALHQVTSSVMVTDSEHVVVFANDAVLDMLHEAESDIRKQVSDFRVESLPGSRVDGLYDTLTRESSLLAGLDATHEARITVADRHYALKATPVKSDDGQRLGSVIEWIDLVDEVTFDESVNKAIASALEGDLSARVVTRNGCSEFIQAAGKNINQMIEIFEAVLKDADKAISAMAEGRLTEKMEGDYRGDFGVLKEGINQTIERLVSVVSDITDSSYRVKDAAGEISRGNLNLSHRTEQQAASLEETSSAMEEITATVQQNAENSIQANTLARGAREAAENGGSVVGRAVEAMQAISDSSNKITDIIGVIDEIAFQTNLLALNAAVEAARAGDQGRGFAVVADEVRSLAGRSATAAKEIKDLIKDSSEKVSEGSELVNRSGDTLEEIVMAVKKVNDIVAEIATASDEQSTGLSEISRAITEMDQMTQQNAALVEEAAAASESMNSQADNLDKLISFFVTGFERKLTSAVNAASNASVDKSQAVATERKGSPSHAAQPVTPQAKPKTEVKVEPKKETVASAKPAVEKKPEASSAYPEDEGDEWEVF